MLSILQASDVPQGGATVFPDIKVSVLPRKGSSLFWFNLFDDGRPDERSKHSVCPVINGDRWSKYTVNLRTASKKHYFSALTKWVHLFPQMFIMPCQP